MISITSFGQEVEIISDGNDRSFIMNFPTTIDSSIPLLIILHGLGESNANWYGVASYTTNQGIATVRPESGTFLNNSGTGYVKLW